MGTGIILRYPDLHPKSGWDERRHLDGLEDGCGPGLHSRSHGERVQEHRPEADSDVGGEAMKPRYESELGFYDPESDIPGGTGDRLACDLGTDADLLSELSAERRITRVGIIYARTIVWLSPGPP